MTQYQGDQTVTVGEWFVTWLVMIVPIVNIVMMFVWAFGSNTKPSKANFFKLCLLMTLISVVLTVILAAIGLIPAMSDMLGGYYY